MLNAQGCFLSRGSIGPASKRHTECGKVPRLRFGMPSDYRARLITFVLELSSFNLKDHLAPAAAPSFRIPFNLNVLDSLPLAIPLPLSLRALSEPTWFDLLGFSAASEREEAPRC